MAAAVAVLNGWEVDGAGCLFVCRSLSLFLEHDGVVDWLVGWSAFCGIVDGWAGGRTDLACGGGLGTSQRYPCD